MKNFQVRHPTLPEMLALLECWHKIHVGPVYEKFSIARFANLFVKLGKFFDLESATKFVKSRLKHKEKEEDNKSANNYGLDELNQMFARCMFKTCLKHLVCELNLKENLSLETKVSHLKRDVMMKGVD